MGGIQPNALDWVESLCRIAVEYRSVDVSIRELFRRAAPHLDEPRLTNMVLERLEREPELLKAWQQYSDDKRGTPSPFLDGLNVGFAAVVDEKLIMRNVRTYGTRVEACAQFIVQEAFWVLEGREPA